MSVAAPRRAGLAQPVLAGVVASIAGFASTFPLVLAGLRAVGASPAQSSSGLLALCLTLGVGCLALSRRYRMPVTLAWSTPGAALLVSAGAVDGGYPAALGAFAVCGLLLALAGLWRPLARLIGAIPGPLAAAMLAGVLLPVCLAPVRAAVELPLLAAPVILAWAVLTRVSRRWAVPGALVVAVLALVVDDPSRATPSGDLTPALVFTAPSLDLAALAGLALPLFIVTMASQNIPGMGVLATFGYRPPLRPILLATGGATAAAAPFGVHAINLAAITAALTAGPEAGSDPARRWVAAASAGAAYLVLGLASGVVVAFVAASPPLIVEAVAGLALLGALGGALTTGLASDEHREAAVVTFVVSASSITALGISAAFWGLVAGLAFLGIQRVQRPSAR